MFSMPTSCFSCPLVFRRFYRLFLCLHCTAPGVDWRRTTIRVLSSTPLCLFRFRFEWRRIPVPGKESLSLLTMQITEDALVSVVSLEKSLSLLSLFLSRASKREALSLALQTMAVGGKTHSIIAGGPKLLPEMANKSCFEELQPMVVRVVVNNC